MLRVATAAGAVPLLAASAAAAPPATCAIVSKGHECKTEKGKALGTFPAPEACAVSACESGAGCAGYFMYSRIRNIFHGHITN